MKVLHVIPTLSTADGGPTFALLAVSEALNKAGIQSEICTTNGDRRSKLDVPLEQPVLVSGSTVRYFNRTSFYYTLSLSMVRWLRANMRSYDVVHIHCLFSFTSTIAARIAHEQGVPYVVRPLGTLNAWGMQNRRRLPKRVSIRLVEGPMLRNAALVHFASEQERCECALADLDTPTAVVPLGVDPSNMQALAERGAFRSKYPELAGKTLVLFLARLNPVKGIDLLLTAFAEVKRLQPNVALVIAGSGDKDYVAQLRAQAQELGIEKDIVWAGFVEGERKLEIFTDADIFVLPSHSENFGVTVVEAMACGLPVVVTEGVGIHPLVTEAGAGLAVRLDTGAIAAGIATLVQDPSTRKQMGARGRLLVTQRLSSEGVARALVTEYEKIVGRQSKIVQEARNL